MIYCIVGVNITDGHICRCRSCCKQPKVSGRRGDASLNSIRTPLVLPLAMSLGMSYKPNLNAHIPGTPLAPGKCAAGTGHKFGRRAAGPRGTWGSAGLRSCPLRDGGAAPPSRHYRRPPAPRRPSAGTRRPAGRPRAAAGAPSAGFPPCPAPRGG